MLLIGLFYILHFDKVLTDQFTVINNIKKTYIQKTDTLTSNISSFFNQAEQIRDLSTKNQELFQYQNLYTSVSNELVDLQNLSQTGSIKKEDLKVVKVLSYVKFDDFTKIWLDTKKDDEKIQALIDGEFSAGIVIKKANNAQALLNGNEKCNYAVFIGPNKAPGIIHNNKHKDLLSIKYIPIWIDISLGDEVITSGMDDIFFEGLKVGKVVKIIKMADQQEAYIKPYSKVLQKKYFYLYNKEVIQKETVLKKSTSKEPKKSNKKP